MAILAGHRHPDQLGWWGRARHGVCWPAHGFSLSEVPGEPWLRRRNLLGALCPEGLRTAWGIPGNWSLRPIQRAALVHVHPPAHYLESRGADYGAALPSNLH